MQTTYSMWIILEEHRIPEGSKHIYVLFMK